MDDWTLEDLTEPIDPTLVAFVRNHARENPSSQLPGHLQRVERAQAHLREALFATSIELDAFNAALEVVGWEGTEDKDGPAPDAKARDYEAEIASVLERIEEVRAEAARIEGLAGAGLTPKEAIDLLADLITDLMVLRRYIPVSEPEGRAADNTALDLIETIEGRVERLQRRYDDDEPPTLHGIVAALERAVAA
jgi:hypothetical protein